MSSAPLMFVGHGSPMMALEKGRPAKLLQEVSYLFSEARAIIVVSAHWLTQGWTLSTGASPRTVHDFGGFPSELYRVQYPAAGDPELAAELRRELISLGIDVQEDQNRGWDHGVWVPLIHLRPEADIPVIQLSLNISASPQQLYSMGEILRRFRHRGIAVILSGSLTHNLYDLRASHDDVASYVVRFQEWIRDRLTNKDFGSLLAADQHRYYARAHPTDEHFLPLHIALGATDGLDELTVLAGGIRHYALSMDSYLWQKTG